MAKAKPLDLQSELAQYTRLAIAALHHERQEVISCMADEFGKDTTSELELQIGGAGYRNLKKPKVLEAVRRRARNVLRLVGEVSDAHKRRDIDAVGVLCLRLAEAWELTVAAAYMPQVHTSEKKVKALREVNATRRKRDGLADKVRAYVKRTGTSQNAAINKVAQETGASISSIKRNLKEKN